MLVTSSLVKKSPFKNPCLEDRLSRNQTFSLGTRLTYSNKNTCKNLGSVLVGRVFFSKHGFLFVCWREIRSLVHQHLFSHIFNPLTQFGLITQTQTMLFLPAACGMVIQRVKFSKKTFVNFGLGTFWSSNLKASM